MPWATGIVTGHLNLLDAVKTFLTTNVDLVAAGQEWTALKDEVITSYAMTSPTVTSPTDGYGATFRGLYLRGPGLAGTDAIHVNILTYEAPGVGAYNWMVQGATGYDGGLLWHQQPGASLSGATFRYLTLNASTIEYWIIANGRRFILTCKIGGDFYSIYCGLYLPYALPSEYPYPLAVSGVTNDVNALPNNATMSNFWHSLYDNPMMLRHVDGAWLSSMAITLYTTQLPTSANFVIWPWSPQNIFISSFSVHSWEGHIDGSFTLLPATLLSMYSGGNVYGELDGVFYIPGVSKVTSPVSEDLVLIGGTNYLVVQDIERATEFSFAALKLA
jgi:hypothetical protein